MNPPVAIRLATEDDARALSALIRRNADVVLSAHYSPDQLAAWKRYNTPDLVRRRMWRRTTFCASLAGRPCATIALQDTELAGLYVAPEARGRGIGRSLLAHLEAFAATRGIAALHLTSIPSALGFYLRNGWRVERAVVSRIMGVDFDETLMTKRMDSRGPRPFGETSPVDRPRSVIR